MPVMGSDQSANSLDDTKKSETRIRISKSKRGGKKAKLGGVFAI